MGTRLERSVLIVGLVLLALNLRSAVTSLGTLLDSAQENLGITPVVAGFLTTLPVLCFAAFGPVATGAARRFGLHRVTLLAIALGCAGQVARAWTDSAGIFLVASAVALAGMASGNVLLPPLVKKHFPGRVGLVTAIYSTSMMTGAALASLISVPIAQASGNWRNGLLVWGLTAGVAMLPWFGLLRHDVRADVAPSRGYSLPTVGRRSGLAWTMALFFGIQSAMAYAKFGWLPKIYVDAGLSQSTAGLLLFTVTSVGIPAAVLMPMIAARWRDQSRLVITLGAFACAGFVGLLTAPTTLPWLWALFLGTGGAAFPWALTMIGLRSRTPDGTAALSGFVQSAGYLIGALGPFAVGALHGATGGWTVPLALLAAACVPMVWCGLRFAKPSYVEDTLP